MLPRRSLAFPLSLGITMICLLVMVLVGWILLTVYGAIRENGSTLYWVLLTLGTVILCGLVVGISFYLAYWVKFVQINQRQANFIDAVTHELKSPLASLKLGLETMSRRQLSENDLQRFTSAMKKDINRMDRLVSHLLDAAGLNVAPEESVRERFRFGTVINECISEVCTYHRFPESAFQVESVDLPYEGRLTDFEVVFRNLIDNAVKYAGSPPKIRIRGEETTGTGALAGEPVLIFTLENNGASIPTSERKRVFGRFERTGIELERVKPGVGLGLYIVRLLLQRNRGQIDLETPESGHGTRVIVKIPAVTKSQSDELVQPDSSLAFDQKGVLVG